MYRLLLPCKKQDTIEAFLSFHRFFFLLDQKMALLLLFQENLSHCRYKTEAVERAGNGTGIFTEMEATLSKFFNTCFDRFVDKTWQDRHHHAIKEALSCQ